MSTVVSNIHRTIPKGKNNLQPRALKDAEGISPILKQSLKLLLRLSHLLNAMVSDRNVNTLRAKCVFNQSGALLSSLGDHDLPRISITSRFQSICPVLSYQGRDLLLALQPAISLVRQPLLSVFSSAALSCNHSCRYKTFQFIYSHHTSTQVACKVVRLRILLMTNRVT